MPLSMYSQNIAKVLILCFVYVHVIVSILSISPQTFFIVNDSASPPKFQKNMESNKKLNVLLLFPGLKRPPCFANYSLMVILIEK